MVKFLVKLGRVLVDFFNSCLVCLLEWGVNNNLVIDFIKLLIIMFVNRVLFLLLLVMFFCKKNFFYFSGRGENVGFIFLFVWVNLFG